MKSEPSSTRAALRTAALLFVIAAASACGRESEPNALPAQLAPAGCARDFNLLLVTFDTVRADAIHCYGDARSRTPVVDSLAERGVRFTRAMAPAPTTMPSHSTLMTGLEPPSHGVRNNGTFRLADEHVTLAERLRDGGYTTAAVIASFVLDARYGLAQGFEHYDDELHLNGVAGGEGHFFQRDADQVTDRALEWLAGQPRAPFFLWMHYFDAHAPYEPPAAHAPAASARDSGTGWDAAATRARYLGEIAFADAELGRLLDALGEERLRRTLVVFAADHGEGLGEHGEFTHSRLIYEASMRVPLVFSCRALFDRAHVVDDRVAGLVDVAPTVLAMLGLEASTRCEGVDLFGAPLDAERAIYGESLVPLLNHGWAPLYSLRRMHDRFISAPRPEYYDLRSDPSESRNAFARSQPDAVELEHRLAQRLTRALPAAATQERELEPDEARRLAALGYTRSAPAGTQIGVLDPKDAIVTWAVLTNAQSASEHGQFERALADVERVLALNPNDAYAWETAYVVHLRRNALEPAEQCLRRVLELSPNCDAYVRLGRLLQRREAFEEIEPLLAAAAQLDPANGEVMLLRGDVYVHQGRYGLAREQYERARELDPVRASAGAKIGLDYLAAQPAAK